MNHVYFTCNLPCRRVRQGFIGDISSSTHTKTDTAIPS